MKLRFFGYTNEITKNGKTTQSEELPVTVNKLDEFNKYTYEFFSEGHSINFSASSDKGEYVVNNFHIEITKVYPEVPLSEEEFLIYEKEKQIQFDFQKNTLLDDDDIEFLKVNLQEYYEEEIIDNIINYHQTKIITSSTKDHFFYPICAKKDLQQLFENIKSINFLPYTEYEIEMPKELETQLKNIITEQNIIRNNNALIEFSNSKNSHEAYKEMMFEEEEAETDRMWAQLEAQIEYNNLSLGEKISRKVKKIFK